MNQTINLQNMSGAFLKRDGHYLLIERSSSKSLAPGVWSCIGGHMEMDELNDPLSACLREITEETGITEDHIFHLALRYIIIRRANDTIRQSYIYFGETDVVDLTGTSEGTLHWIPEAELLNRKFTQTYEAMVRHSLTNEQNHVVIGVAENHGGKLHMAWSVAEDFE